MRKIECFFLSLCLAPTLVHAQGAAPEMYDVREVIIENARFDDQKAADACGLSRDQIATVITTALKGTKAPAIAEADAKPQSLGVARIELVPEISTYTNESLDCVSWISLSAQSRVNAVIPPVSTLRTETILYWQQHTKVASGQSNHLQKMTDTLQKMAAQFAQQYQIDQPPDMKK
jgi:hypothetical protein